MGMRIIKSIVPAAGLLLVCLTVSAGAARYYVATTGNDTNLGTQALPLKTVAAGLAKAASGDTVFVRAGTYASSTTITISKSGAAVHPCCLLVFPGDQRPLLDFSSMPLGSGNRGIRLSGSYWYIRGFSIKGAGDNGMNISGSGNIIEYCEFFENQDSGCQLGGGAANNQIINCDAYFNVDTGQGNADGFSPKLDVGTGNYFKGCRSWQNSDDGCDGYLRPSDDITTTYENCWCYKNGYLKSGSASRGNGNGFKMGGSDAKDLRHNVVLKNCLSASNRVKGFDQNNDVGSMTLYNCTAYGNGTNYQINASVLASGKTLTVINCVSAGSGAVSITGGTMTTDSWMSPFVVSSADFVGVDPSAMTAARKADGSLPDITFMHLAAGSDLIDAGTNVGLPYRGSRPDLGCFETSATNTLSAAAGTPDGVFTVRQAGARQVIKAVFFMQEAMTGTLSFHDLAGKRICSIGPMMFFKGRNEQTMGLGRAGTFLCRLSTGSSGHVRTLVVQ
jgi:hypothetical protein